MLSPESEDRDGDQKICRRCNDPEGTGPSDSVETGGMSLSIHRCKRSMCEFPNRPHRSSPKAKTATASACQGPPTSFLLTATPFCMLHIMALPPLPILRPVSVSPTPGFLLRMGHAEHDRCSDKRNYYLKWILFSDGACKGGDCG